MDYYISVASPVVGSGAGSGSLGCGSGADTFALGGFSALGLDCALEGGTLEEDLSAEKLGRPFGMTGTTGIEPCLITGAEPVLGAPAAVLAVTVVGAPANIGAAPVLGASVAAGAVPSTVAEPDSAAPEICSLCSSVSIFSLPLVLACCSCLLISPAAAVACSFAFEKLFPGCSCCCGVGLMFSLEFILASAARAACGRGPDVFEASDDKASPVLGAATDGVGMVA